MKPDAALPGSPAILPEKDAALSDHANILACRLKNAKNLRDLLA